MSEIIDLEDMDYDSLYGQESDHHTGSASARDSMLDGKTSQPPRLITIKSYTEICIDIEAGDSPAPEESSPRVKPKLKKDTKLKDSNNNKLSDPHSDKKPRRFSRPKVTFPKSKDKVNVWSRQSKVEVNKKKKDRAPCWLVVFVFCCGVSKEHQWYSLLGKGAVLAFFLSIVYLVVCLTVLPFVIIAAGVGAVFFGAGMVSYLAFSSKKVGVSFDDDGDASCIGAVWGSWV